jgi:hypothetical protein
LSVFFFENGLFSEFQGISTKLNSNLSSDISDINTRLGSFKYRGIIGSGITLKLELGTFLALATTMAITSVSNNGILATFFAIESPSSGDDNYRYAIANIGTNDSFTNYTEFEGLSLKTKSTFPGWLTIRIYKFR